MKLTHLDLTAFRSYTETTFDLKAPRVLFAGRNNSGKTSIRSAIRWVLTGHCEGTDAKGAGADVLIPTGAKFAEVGVGIAGVGLAKRTCSASGGGTFSVEGFTGTSQTQHQGLLMKLNTTPAFLDAVLCTETFLDLTHQDAKALVLSLLNVQIPVGVKVYTLDELDLHYKQAFEDRKVAKRTLQQLAVPTQPVASELVRAFLEKAARPLPEAITLLEGQLRKFRGELGTLQQTVGSANGRRKALTDEQARLQKVVSDPLPEDVSETLTELQGKVEGLEQAVVPAVAPKKGDPRRLTFLRSLKDRIEAHDPEHGCVIDGTVPCDTAYHLFSNRLTDIAKEIEGLEGSPTQASPTPTESPLTVIRKRISALETQQAHRQAKQDTQAHAAERLQAIVKELTELPSTAEQDGQISTLQDRIQKGENLLADARAYASQVQTYEGSVKQHTEAKAEVARLEQACADFGPNGARATALKEAMGKFEAAVNPYVKPFGWTITFSVEPWGAFANGRPVETYSRSERYRIGLALQLAIAQLSGLSFCIVDEIDMLDVENRNTVSQMLLTAPLEQILILGTRENAQPIKVPKGALAYRLGSDKGQSKVLENVA